MPRIAGALLGRERAGQHDLAAVPLPIGEAADQRVHVLVAQLLQRLGGERRAVTGGAVDDHGCAAVAGDPFHARLEMPARDVDGIRDVPLLPFVHLAHIDPDGAVEGARRFRVDLGDRRLRRLKQLAVRGHNYINGSGRSLHSHLASKPIIYLGPVSAAARVRLIVGLAAVVAAGVVAGVVLATRQTPTQPSRQCDERAQPLIVPGVRSAEVAAARSALPAAREAGSPCRAGTRRPSARPGTR